MSLPRHSTRPPARRQPLHLGAGALDEITRLAVRLEQAARAEWTAHPVLGSDVMLAVAYLRKLTMGGTP